MRKFLLPLFFLLILFSCGKKRKVLSHGSIEENGIATVTFEEFIDHDSAFEVFTDIASGRIWKMKRAKDVKKLHDSTFSLNVYFIPSGKLRAQKQYILKKPVGS